MRTRRSRTVAAPPAEIWSLATDPSHLPRWWPATQRVEAVSPAGWTSVFTTPRGRTVRADYSVVTREPPRRAVWRQDLEGSPFERLFAAVRYELEIEPEDGAAVVSLTVEQTARGWARLGGIQLKAAARRQLDLALAQLAGLLEDPHAA